MSTILSIRVKNICFSMSSNKIWSKSSLLLCYSDESKEPLVTVIQPEVRSTTVKKLGLFSVIGISIVFTQVWYIILLSVFVISKFVNRLTYRKKSQEFTNHVHKQAQSVDWYLRYWLISNNNVINLKYLCFHGKFSWKTYIF